MVWCSSGGFPCRLTTPTRGGVVVLGDFQDWRFPPPSLWAPRPPLGNLGTLHSFTVPGEGEAVVVWARSLMNS